MPNFKCQNNLKDPKLAVERQATFYSLSFSNYSKQGMGGVSNKQLKNGIALRLLHVIYSLPLAESLLLHRVDNTETLIIPEVEIQFMFSRFLVQLLC